MEQIIANIIIGGLWLIAFFGSAFVIEKVVIKWNKE